MPIQQTLNFIVIISLALFIYAQNQRIKKLESRISTLLKTTPSGEDERLIYLRDNLAHLDKVKAIKALRERYPELSLVDAHELWKQSQSK